MKQFLQEFRTFAVRGNVVDLAVAVIIGTAFGKIVSSLVDTVIMPLIGIIVGGINLSNLAFTIGDTTVSYGMFLQSVVDFVIIAFVIFLAIRIMNKVSRKEEQKKEAAPSTEVVLLTEIRDLLKK